MNLFLVLLIVISIGVANAYAYSPNPDTTHQMITPVTVFGKTYHLQVDNSTYDIYYGFDTANTLIQKITLVPEHNTMHLDLTKSNETDAMWIHFPISVISADKNDFVLYIDGQEKKYELTESDHSIVMGFVVPANAQSVDIQGTRVIPEFPIAAVVTTISFAMVIYGTRFFKQ